MPTSSWRAHAVAVTLCFAALWTLVGARPQAQNPQFRSGVDLVTLDVAVLDRAGNPVTGLTKDDFVVLENGKPQTVSTFVAVTAPTPPPDRATWERSVTTEVVENSGAEERLLALVIDDATLPQSPWMIQATKTAARTFIEELGPRDKAAIIFTRNNRHAQDFTSDKARLLAAAERVQPGFPPHLYYYRSSLSTLSRLSDYLAQVPLRKKAIVWLGIGVPLDTDGISNIKLSSFGTTMEGAEATQSLWNGFRRAIDRAQRGNVAIYGISPAGLSADSSYRHFNESLQAMASNTGGRAFIETNDVKPGIAKVLQETGNYYLVGYSPTPRGPDGSYRRVEVKTLRSDLDVRSRGGYFVTPPPPPPKESVALGLSAIAGVLPRTEIPLRAAAPAFIYADGTSAVALTIALDRRALPPPGSGEAIITTNIFTNEGNARGNYTQHTPLCDTGEWCEISVVVPIRPGQYSLRVGVEHRPSGRSGSVYVDAVAPDVRRNGLLLTGVVLETTPAGPRRMDAAIRALLPAVPTLRRELQLTDQASASFRIHQGGKRSLFDVSRTIRIRNDKDVLVIDQTDVIPAASFGGGRSVDQRVELPLSRLSPGRYLLTIEARESARPSGLVERRQLVFSVR
jgi:VWFA-related protein